MNRKYHIAIGILIGVLLLLPFAILAFKILHRLVINHNWNGLSVIGIWLCAVFSLLGACISGVAVFYAVQIQKKIANEQKRIALFEKRYEVYNLLYKWYYLSEQILLHAATNQDARSIFTSLYDIYDNDIRLVSNRMLSLYRETVDELYKLYLLFPVNRAVHKGLIAFLDVIYKIVVGNTITSHKKELQLLMVSPEIKYIFETMQRELSASR